MLQKSQFSKHYKCLINSKCHTVQKYDKCDKYHKQMSQTVKYRKHKKNQNIKTPKNILSITIVTQCGTNNKHNTCE